MKGAPGLKKGDPTSPVQMALRNGARDGQKKSGFLTFHLDEICVDVVVAAFPPTGAVYRRTNPNLL